MVKIICSYCGMEAERELGHVNRAVGLGRKLYCDRRCAGLGRRKNISTEDAKLAKRLYDIEYRNKNYDLVKKRNADYCKTKAGREMQARNRAKFKEYHKRYVKTPEYRAWKKNYDRRHRASKHYGEYAECFLLVMEIEAERDNREVKQQLGLVNKSQIKRRSYEKFKRNKSEIGPLGDLECR